LSLVGRALFCRWISHIRYVLSCRRQLELMQEHLSSFSDLCHRLLTLLIIGMVADMYDVDSHQYALNYIVLASCSGSAIGPIVGAFVEKNLSWHWVFWIQLM
jgi:MFS family permease